MAPAALELSGVRVRFDGLVALDDVSLEVPQNHVVGVIGPNGAGKTTLFNVVCGFVRPDEGELRRNGQPLRRKHRAHDLAGLGIGRTLQGLGLFPGLTVAENVMVGAGTKAKTGLLSALLALPRADRDEARLRERALAKLAEVGAPDDIADRLPHQLPYGVQKRVALARALVCDPDLILLDEPAAGLSAEEIGELGALIKALGHSVVLVEHHMDLVMKICDEVIVLDFGKVIARGTPEEIRDDPAVIDAYLGEEVATEATSGPGE
ncbi:ABC transporter ATP-binding protein [Actinomadura sp. DC4]|uniref:ABC transporter ATP-binding protein n=1 Tax=Actinomadura sp. DC4 TaxID=3055069 RepID=UPI0025B1FCCD|nr:ABC transporter ATP-binding protein [Actinomadura sp. DC4]MDN3354297.1 ABC transporter ATP-binding protein [Actinomadura sp. DC4]